MSSETTKTGNAGLVKIAPVMFAFFVMGFVDLVGTATNYVKAEFNLANGTANLFTTMVFFWFLIFAVPTGMLMNKIGRCFKLLFSDHIVFLCFLGIVAHVGVDVGINAQAPRILTEHTGDTFTEIAATATMVYFIARMIGCFTGGIVLSKISNHVGILVCGIVMTASAVCFTIFCSITSNPPAALFWVAVALVGFGNSNVFSLFLSHTLMYRPEHQNEISGLMLMGLIGGAIFPPIMGALADAMSAQLGAIIVMSVGCIYVLVIGVGYKAIIEGKKAAVKA